MVTLRLFASLREAVGERTVEIEGATVGEVLANASRLFGDHFAALIPTCQIWVNGEPSDHDTPVTPADEVALLPPVSGG